MAFCLAACDSISIAQLQERQEQEQQDSHLKGRLQVEHQVLGTVGELQQSELRLDSRQVAKTEQQVVRQLVPRQAARCSLGKMV